MMLIFLSIDLSLGILKALVTGARLDRNSNKIVVHAGISSDTIIFNVGGSVFETRRTTLK